MATAHRLVVLVAVLGISPVALAEAEEQRLNLSASGALATTATAGSSASAPQGAFTLGYTYGVKDWLALGGEAFFATGEGLVFDDALVDDQPGQLRATMYTGGLAATVRAEAGVDVAKLLATTHPYVTLGVGLLARSLGHQQLVDPASGLLVLEPDAELDLRPFASLELGVEHRFGSSFAAALAVGGRFAGDAYAAGELRLAVSWYWY